MFFYNVTVGILQSAHEGSVLGQRWSSLWAPLRVIFAVGLLVPIPGAGGYNLAQTGVAYIVRGATNIASIVWAESATLVISGATPITAANATIEPDTIARMFENAVCRAIVSDQLATVAPLGSPMQLQQIPSSNDGQITVTTVLVDSSGNRHADGICGAYSTPELPSYISNIMPLVDGIALPVDQRDEVRTAFINAHRDAMTRMSAAMDTIVATDFLAVKRNTGTPNADTMANAISAALTQANTDLSADMDEILDMAIGADRNGQTARDALLDRITGNCSNASPDTIAASLDAQAASRCYGEGWVGAGSWYMMMARLNNEVSSLTAARSTVESGSYIRDTIAFANQSDTILTQSGGEYSMFAARREGYRDDAGMVNADEAFRIANAFSSTFETATARLAALGFTLSTAQNSELMENVTNAESMLADIPLLRESLIEATEFIINLTSPGGAGGDPMTGMISVGHILMGIGLGILAVVSISSFMGVSLAIMVSPFVVTLVTTGSLLSYILPMMPFFFWILAVSGYFLLIVEAVVAVNLWALAHMRMDGEGISGEAGRNGWLMLLSLMMTPVLMVFGFLIGMTIFRVTSTLINIGIHQAISGVASGGVLSQLIALVVYSVLIASFYMVIIERSFSLVSEFPGRVLRWIGASAELTKGEEDRVRAASIAAGAAIYKGLDGKYGGITGAAERGGAALKALKDNRKNMGSATSG